MHRPPLALLAVSCATACVLACTTSRLVTPGGETKLGNELAAQVEESIGLVENPKTVSYVEQIGARLVDSSDSIRHSLDYRFRVIDMAAPNAFALPGGNIYVSRGLLELLQTEDELANVLAHEIAHVSARHHLRHAVRQTPLVPLKIATGIGALATGIVSPFLGKTVAVLGNAPGDLVLASYSRGQESQADELGQGFAAAAGWDPLAMSRLMDTLGRDEAQRGGDPNLRSYFATHPRSPDRAQKTAARAETLTPATRPPIAPDRRDFLRRLEGLLVGSPASEGVIADNEYLHPTLDFHLTFPQGWKLVQDDHSVRAVAEQKDAMVLVTLAAKGTDTDAVARQVLEEVDFELESGPTTRWSDNLSGTYATARYEQGGKSYRYALAWIAHGEYVYQISAGAYLHTWAKRKSDLESVAASFRPLAASDEPKLREGRLRVVAAMGRSLEAVMPSASAWSLEEASVANGIDAETGALLNDWFKVAPLERYTPKPKPR